MHRKFSDRLTAIIDALIEIAFIASLLLAILAAVWLSAKILCSLADAKEPPAIAPSAIEQTAADKLAGEDKPAEGCAVLDIGEPLGKFTLTAYCPCVKCCNKEDGITATGATATENRTIAVDPAVIPYGSTVTLYFTDGTSHTYIAEDCGGTIKQNRIDVFFDSHEAARAFGVQSAMVYVEVAAYYATEIDKYAIQATQHNFHDTVQLGDAFQVREEDWTL